MQGHPAATSAVLDARTPDDLRRLKRELRDALTARRNLHARTVVQAIEAQQE